MTLLQRVQQDIPERLGRVGVAARHAVESVLQGQHRSIHRGLSVEFAGHRPYVPGDDLRHLDWSVWARTDRYDVRLYEEETRLRATILVDYSGSMAYRSDGSTSTKLEFARTLAAALVFLMVRQGDAVGLAQVDDHVRRLLPPASTMGHALNMLEFLEEMNAGGDTNLGPVIEEVGQRLSRRGLVLIITDGLDEPESFLRSLALLRYRKQDIRVLHVVDPMEEQFTFSGTYQFTGLEREAPVVLDADRMRQHYRESFAQHRRALESGCHKIGAQYAVCRSDADPAQLLVHLLSHNQGVPGAQRA